MPAPHPSNDNRPAEFDRLVTSYIPGLHALAKRLRPTAPQDTHDELVQDTLCKALSVWHQYRPGSTPMPWLKFLMRAINRDALKSISRQREIASRLASVPFQAILPNQEDATDLSIMLGTISPDLRDDMLDVAQGGDMAQVGARRGVSRERVRQIFNAERARWAALATRADTRRALAA